jgi:hypothetical protein
VSASRRRFPAAYTLPKLGRTPVENEDSVALCPSRGRFAIADGASTSARPEVWSRLLVDAYVGLCADPLDPPVLTGLRSEWNGLVRSAGLPWFAVAKLDEGASSTFLGLLVDGGTGEFRAYGVGDSCLFHVRGHRIVLVGPIQHPDGFGRFPDLVSSRPGGARPEPVWLAGSGRPGDVLLLATDALARFLLETHDRYGRLPQLGPVLADQRGFTRRVAGWRRRGLIGNDDTTLCAVWL